MWRNGKYPINPPKKSNHPHSNHPCPVFGYCIECTSMQLRVKCKELWRLGQNPVTHFESLLLRHGPAHCDTLPGGGGSIFRWHYRSSRQEEGGISSWRISAGLAMFEVLEKFIRFTNLAVSTVVCCVDCTQNLLLCVRMIWITLTYVYRFISKVAVAVQISLT